eukprot:437210-Heterocapsa_arctica.AAC.2
MEEDAVELIDWRRQRADNNYIVPNQDVIPTTDMEMKIKVEERQGAEESRNCMPNKKNAVVDFETDDIKEEATMTIGGWKQNSFWIEASTRQKI